MSVYLNAVTIRGVMGIPNALPLDLTAPLTLIYAPNGTGKTSTWTAVKSLLCMGVNGSTACRAPGAEMAMVTAELLIGDKHCTATAADGKLELVDHLKGRVTGTEALARLAPEVTTVGVQTKGGVLRDRLISQIESCRFLPSESLLYLIDSGEESTELRRKLFADLTGTSAIQAEVRETKRYREILSTELEVVTRELLKVEEQAKAFAVEHNPNSSDPLHLIATAATMAKVEIPPELSAPTALVRLRRAQMEMSLALEASRSAFVALRSIESAYGQLDADISIVAEELAIANAALDRRKELLKAVQDGGATVDVSRARHGYEQFQHGLGRIAGILAMEGRTTALTDSTVRVLRRSVQSFNSEYEIESRLNAWTRLNEWRPKYRSQLSQRADILEKKRLLLAQEPISAREVKAKLGEKTIEFTALTKRITNLSDLAISLRASAMNWVSTSRSSTCPCCSHQWESVGALLAAIAAGGEVENVQLKEEIDALQVGIEQLRIEHEKAQIVEEQLRDHEVTLVRLNAGIDEVERLAAANGIDLARLREPENTLHEVYQLQSLLCVWRLLEALNDLRTDLDDGLTVEVALNELFVRSDVLKAAVTSAEQVEAERKLRIQREQGELSLSSDLAESRKRRMVELMRVKHQRDDAVALLKSNGFSASERSQGELEEQSATLEMLGILITQASAAVEVSAAISARERIAKNQIVLQIRRDKILGEVELANRLIRLQADAESHAGQRFFDQLGPAVGMLFDHMQVNRVFRALSVRASKGSFFLDGQLDDEVCLDPGEHFSQGQRQDLALSMFLVRAASLGGSFFLDEPLVHLDDLNRTALLDCLRACVLGTQSSSRPVRLIVTTANWSVARHLMQKFHSVRHSNAGPLLRVIQLSGNVGTSVQQSVVFPVDSSSELSRAH